jgi:hypothetical protein
MREHKKTSAFLQMRKISINLRQFRFNITKTDPMHLSTPFRVDTLSMECLPVKPFFHSYSHNKRTLT